jgi:hypothetical protein
MFLNVSNPSSMDAAHVATREAIVCKSSCVKNSLRAFASYRLLTVWSTMGGYTDVSSGRTRGGTFYSKARMFVRYFDEVLEEEEVAELPEEVAEVPEVAAILEIKPELLELLEIKPQVTIESADFMVEEKPRVDFVEEIDTVDSKPVLSVSELEAVDIVDMDFAYV